MLYQTGSTAAVADNFTFTEDELLTSGLLVGNIITLDTLANDAGGLAIYSIDAATKSTTITAAQLQNDDLKKTATISAWETLSTGDKIRIVGDKIELDISASLARLGVSSVAELATGQTIQLSFAYAFEYIGATKPVDWTTVTFSLTGQSLVVNHEPVIGGDIAGAVTEDVDTHTATGTLTIADADAGQSSFIARPSVSGTYGTFTLAADGAWTYTLDNSRTAVQALGAGVTAEDRFTATSFDGSATQTVTVQVSGTNDKAEVTGTFNGQVTEDGSTPASGTLTVTDLDAGQAVFTTTGTVAGQYGSFSFVPGANGSGQWTYALDHQNADVQALPQDAVIYDRLIVTTGEGGHATVVVTIVGTDDVPTITGAVTGDVVEDGPITASGTLTVDDRDANQSAWASTNPASHAGTYGSFTFTAATGEWVYTLDNAAAQSLAGGQAAQDHMTVMTVDGTPQDIVVTISGKNDAAAIGGGGDFVVVEDASASTTAGRFTVYDMDTGEAGFATISASSQYGSFTTTSSDGQLDWTYHLDNTRAEVQALAAGEELTEQIIVTSSDGTAVSAATVRIVGVNDQARIEGTSKGQVSANTGVAGTATGTLQVIDPDIADRYFAGGSASSEPQTFLGHYGTFTFNAGTGVWSYAVSLSDEVNRLKETDAVRDSLTVTSHDGTASATIDVDIQGVNNRALITSGGQTVTLHEDYVSTITRQISLSDPDWGESTFRTPVVNHANYGTFTFSGTGNTLTWTYQPGAAVQTLRANETASESFTVTSADGTLRKEVLVEIRGANDAATFTGDTTGQVTVHGQASFTGALTVNDVDHDQTGFQSLGADPIVRSYGSFTFDAASGAWTYNLDSSLSAVQWLQAGQTLSDTLQVASIDGTTQTLAVTIQGDVTLAPLTTGADIVVLANDGQTQYLAGFDPALDTLHLASSFTGLVDRDGHIAGEHWATFSSQAAFSASEAMPFARMVWIPGSVAGEGALYYVAASSSTLGTAVAQFTGLASAPQPEDITLAFMAPPKPAYGSVTGTAGDDVMSGTAGADSAIDGLGGNDIIFTTQADNAYGGAGDDRLYGNIKNSALYGGDGNDLLFGASNATVGTVMYGNAGSDSFYGSNIVDAMYGGTGADLMFGAGGSDQLYAEDGNDWLFGGDGNDRLVGGNGDDHLDGGAGDDQLSAGPGSDWLTGGTGRDTIYLDTVNAAMVDHITDYTSGEDILVLAKNAMPALATPSGSSTPNTLLASDFAGFDTDGATADAGTAHIVYDASTGNLYYDSDGGSSANSTLVAVLDNKPGLAILDASDFGVQF